MRSHCSAIWTHATFSTGLQAIPAIRSHSSALARHSSDVIIGHPASRVVRTGTRCGPLDLPDEVGETGGHGRRTSTELFPQSSPDLYPDCPRAFCLLLRQQDAIPTHGLCPRIRWGVS